MYLLVIFNMHNILLTEQLCEGCVYLGMLGGALLGRLGA